MKAKLGLVAALAGAVLTMSSAQSMESNDDGMNKLGKNFYGCATGQNDDVKNLSTARSACGNKIPVQTVFLDARMD